MAPVPPAPPAPEPQAWLPEGIGEAALLAELRRLSWGAAAILRAYGRGEQPPYGFAPVLSVEEGGEGPVSAADLAVNQWLLDGRAQAFPAAPWTLLSEETAKQQLSEGVPLEAEWLWILDPLDGTKDFLQGTGEYAVHLALVRGQEVVLGVVLLPEPEELWFGLLGGGAPRAWRENRLGERFAPAISSRNRLPELVLVASRNHRDSGWKPCSRTWPWEIAGRSAASAPRWPRSCGARPISTSPSRAVAPPRTGIWPPQMRYCGPPAVPSATPMAAPSPTTRATCAKPAAWSPATAPTTRSSAPAAPPPWRGSIRALPFEAWAPPRPTKSRPQGPASGEEHLGPR